MAQTNGNAGLTLTMLGCGTLGTSILSGILDSLSDLRSSQPPHSGIITGTSTPAEEVPAHLPNHFIACVRRHESAKRVAAQLSQYKNQLTICEDNNLAGAQAGDIVILGCKPYGVAEILQAEGIKKALEGKLLISICAGVPVEQIDDILYPGQSHAEIIKAGGCTVVRAMPNTASKVRESMTVIATSTPPLQPQQSSLVTWIFTRIGRVVHLPPSMMDISTALCGSGPAFMALVLEAIADGAVAMGLPRAEAQTMAAQTMRGTTGLVLDGEHPAILRDKVSTPGGCTIGGLLVLEEGRVRGTLARAVREACVVASQLGKGVQGVNGTRF
ncbi:delta 1-pyrroline-5-carboxylate reductase [Elasticomyces elasticus]|nr:delta 1-pyrroline-5-carboxylate reductase [Elasticomyces elasticus]